MKCRLCFLFRHVVSSRLKHLSLILTKIVGVELFEPSHNVVMKHELYYTLLYHPTHLGRYRLLDPVPSLNPAILIPGTGVGVFIQRKLPERCT